MKSPVSLSDIEIFLIWMDMFGKQPFIQVRQSRYDSIRGLGSICAKSHHLVWLLVAGIVVYPPILWLFFVSLFCGFIALFFPPALIIVKAFIAVLTLTQRREAYNTAQVSKRKKQKNSHQSTLKMRRKKIKKRGKRKR